MHVIFIFAGVAILHETAILTILERWVSVLKFSIRLSQLFISINSMPLMYHSCYTALLYQSIRNRCKYDFHLDFRAISMAPHFYILINYSFAQYRYWLIPYSLIIYRSEINKFNHFRIRYSLKMQRLIIFFNSYM